MPPWQQTAIYCPLCYFLGQLQKHKIQDLEMLMLHHYCRGSRSLLSFSAKQNVLGEHTIHFNLELNIWGLDATFI